MGAGTPGSSHAPLGSDPKHTIYALFKIYLINNSKIVFWIVRLNRNLKKFGQGWALNDAQNIFI